MKKNKTKFIRIVVLIILLSTIIGLVASAVSTLSISSPHSKTTTYPEGDYEVPNSNSQVVVSNEKPLEGNSIMIPRKGNS